MEIRCTFCNGTGEKYKNRYSEKEICPVCYGAGDVEIPTNSNLTECAFCGGTGEKDKDRYSTREICPACNGLGSTYKRKFE